MALPPLNSAKQNRLARWPEKKKFANAAKKKVRTEEELFFLVCFLDVVFGRFESEPRRQIFVFLLPRNPHEVLQALSTVRNHCVDIIMPLISRKHGHKRDVDFVELFFYTISVLA